MAESTSELAVRLDIPDLLDGFLTSPFQTIPKRVKCNKRIKIDTSLIPGAGRGMIVRQKVERGDLIFEIEDPMFTVVEDGKYLSMNSCDNCFATKEEESGFTNVMSSDIEFMACAGCKVAHYCSKACQTTAWKHHHKFECQCLKDLLEVIAPPDPPGQTTQSRGVEPIYQSRYRLLIRLMRMHHDGMVSPDQWEEIMGLDWDRKLSEDDTSYHGALEAAIYIAHKTGFTGTEPLVVRLMLITSINEMRMDFPLLRPLCKNYKLDSPYVVNAGRCFDPFVSLINHSCDPNAIVHFEGRKLRVFAQRDLSRGNEIYVSYINHSNYKVRQEELKTHWRFTCSCPVCVIGERYMHGPAALFNRIIFAIEEHPGSLQVSVNVTEDEKTDKEVFAVTKRYIMLHYKNCLLRYYLKGDYEEALRSCVKLYTVSGFVTPAVTQEEHQDILYHMIHLLESQKTDLGKAIPDSFRLQLRHLRAEHIEISFGVDSMWSRFERADLQKMVRGWEKKHSKKWVLPRGRVIGDHNFIENFALLLEWADVPPDPFMDV